MHVYIYSKLIKNKYAKSYGNASDFDLIYWSPINY